MAEQERLLISRQEHYAPNRIAGLPEEVHYMVILAKPADDDQWVLEGNSAAFDLLSSELSDEIHAVLSQRSRMGHLAKLYARLNPDSD